MTSPFRLATLASPFRLATITQHRSFRRPNFSYPPSMRQAHRPQARNPCACPRSLLSRPIFLAALLSLILSFAFLPRANADLPATPQSPATVDLSNLGDRVPLGPIWLIHPGDNPAWASPTLDDHDWTPIDITKPAPPQLNGSPVYWYRLHANLRPGLQDLAFLTAFLDTPRELFVNGTEVAHFGDVSKGGRVPSFLYVASDIPNQALEGKTGRLLIAIRTSCTGRPCAPPLKASSRTGLFLQTQREAQQEVSYRIAHWFASDAVDIALNLLAFLIAVAIAFALPQQREYAAAAVALLAVGLQMFFENDAYPFLNQNVSVALGLAIEFIGKVALIEFARVTLGKRRTRLFWVAVVLALVASVLFYLGGLLSASSYWHLRLFLTSVICDLFIYALIFGMLLPPARRGSVDARVLLPALLLNGFAAAESVVLYAHALLSGVTEYQLPGLNISSYRFFFYDIADDLFAVTILLFLVLRTLRLARERARIGVELQAARTTQELLLARSRQPTPGFHVEAIYHPAAEVGGDFFLVSPAPDGSLTAIVGDVSGKGLVAALRVSMILGVLHRANQDEDARDPASILAHLNQALLSGGDLGFTTACCIHLHPSGQLHISNAGHISPYLAGHELPTDSALPLGLAPDQTYPTTTATVLLGQTLVLLSDGVVEARSSKGELFGFDRLPDLTRLSAAEIADTAQRFGQEDDITVLTIRCA